MTGEQIVQNCADIAKRQYEGDELGAARFEIDLLRTKVLELAKLSAAPCIRDTAPASAVPATYLLLIVVSIAAIAAEFAPLVWRCFA